ncbi:MAG: DnaD domain protein [Paraclostridium sp.]
MDIDLFKRAIEIATNNAKCNKGYVSGIINQWRNNNIKNLKDLNAYKLSKEQGGSGNVGFKRDVKEEDGAYRKPTEEELEEFREFLKEKL